MKKLMRKLGVVICALALVVSGFSGIAMDKADAATKYAKSVTVTVNGKVVKGGYTADLHIGNKTTPKVYLKTSVAVSGGASKVATAKVVSGTSYVSLSKTATNKYKVTPKKAGKAKVKITASAKSKSGKTVSKYIYLKVTKPAFKCTTKETKIMTSKVKTFKLSANASYKSVTAKVTKSNGAKTTDATITKVSNKEWNFKAAKAGRYKVTFTATTCHNKATSTAVGYVTVLPRYTTFGPVSQETVTASASISDMQIKKADGTDGTKAFFDKELSGIVKANADAFGVDTTFVIGADTYDIIYKNGKLAYKKNGANCKLNAAELAAIKINKGDAITHTNYQKLNVALATLKNGGKYTSDKYTFSATVNGTQCEIENAYYKDGTIYFTTDGGKSSYKAYYNDKGAFVVVWVSGTPQDFSKTYTAKAIAGVIK